MTTWSNSGQWVMSATESRRPALDRGLVVGGAAAQATLELGDVRRQYEDEGAAGAARVPGAPLPVDLEQHGVAAGE